MKPAITLFIVIFLIASHVGAADHEPTLGKKGKALLEEKFDGQELLRAKAEDFRVKKPGLVLRVSGADSDGVLIDNVRVWELN